MIFNLLIMRDLLKFYKEWRHNPRVSADIENIWQKARMNSVTTLNEFSFVDINYLCLYLEHMVRVCTECRIYWIFRQCLLCLCICVLFILTLYQPHPFLLPFWPELSKAYEAWMPLFSHTTQEMNIQMKTLSWRLNLDILKRCFIFAMILFKFCQLCKYQNGLPFPFSRRSSQPRNQAHISCISFYRRFFTSWATRGSPKCLQFYIIIESEDFLILLPPIWAMLTCFLR